jgi:colicin import membrane protein
MFTGYRLSLLGSVGLHVILLILLIVGMPHSPVDYAAGTIKNAEPVVEVVKAVSVDQAAVEAQIQAIQQAREQQRQTALQAEKQLQQQAEQAKKQRQQEEKRLQDLKRQQQTQQQKLNKELAELKRQQQQEQQQLQQLQQQQTQAKRQQQQEQQRLAELTAEREAEQQIQQARVASQMDRYKQLILQAISQHWILPDQVDRTLSARFEIRLAPDGKVLAVTLLSSSQDPVLDRSAQTAIYNASPLPVPGDPEIFNHFQVFHLTVRPEEIL